MHHSFYPANCCPISLCNVSYKLISKILAEKTKKVLHQVIGLEQGAFISDISITDNILLGTEAFYWINRRQTGQWQPMTLKL